MRRFAFSLAIISGFVTLLLASAPAHAQATRTWVSGVGDDVNPCSRTAPCKTFAGAISKTAAGGEIDCLDPGGFGTVTIVKAITIDCQGTMGSILASGTTGININAGATDNVVLRNLSINGAGTTLGTKGINILAANVVWIENVRVFGFSQQGIIDSRSTGDSINVIDTIARNNGGAGLAVGTATGTARKVLVDNFRSLNNGTGLFLSPNTNAMVKNSDLSSNTNAGIDNTGANIGATNNAISNNGTGVLNESGTTRLSNNDLAGNTTGINVTGGTVKTYGTNRNNTTTSGTVTPAGGATSDLGQQ